MKVNWVSALCAFLMAISHGATNADAQTAADSVEAHVALAKQAAGKDYSRMFENLCAEPRAPAGQPAVPAVSPARPPLRNGTPSRPKYSTICTMSAASP